MKRWLIYGANGYTGELIARLSVARGQRPILAGRREETVRALATAIGLEHRVFALDDPAALDAGLKDVIAVLHCAGPFSRTAKPMAEACIRTGVHYLDITGELDVFESLAERDAQARSAGVMLLPGIGFDVVPSDCLALHLKQALPTATTLALGIQALGRLSHGTATTLLENVHRGGAIRKNGVIAPVPTAWKERAIDFGNGPQTSVTIPWGDVSTAFHSTGIPNIEVYVAAPAALRVGLKLSRPFGWLLGSKPVQQLLQRPIELARRGPSEVERAKEQSHVWGEVTDEAGRKRMARLRAPEAYTLTTLTALAAIDKVLVGNAPAGFQTPAKAYGADFILEIEGVTREDVIA